MILITRPEAQATETRLKLEALGHKVLCHPFINIEYLEVNFKINPGDYDALIVTSQNAAIAVKDQESFKNIKTFVVGDKTQETLISFGFKKVISAGKDSYSLIELINTNSKRNAKLFYLRGEHIAADLKSELEPNFQVDEQVVYRSLTINKLPKELKVALKNEINIILFYSARTAESFYNSASDLNLSHIYAICISQNVSNQLRAMKFKDIKTAHFPTEEAMIKLL